MTKGAPTKTAGPQLATVVCGETDAHQLSIKLNLNCPLGIFLSYVLQNLRPALSKRIKAVAEEADAVVPVIPSDTPEDQLESVTISAKETAGAEKDKLTELVSKLEDINGKLAASTAYDLELLDEGNSIVQCQENIKLNASEVLKPYTKYTVGVINRVEGEAPSVLPMIIGGVAVTSKKK